MAQVINAMITVAQSRRRVFFFIYRNDIPFAHQMDQWFEE